MSFGRAEGKKKRATKSIEIIRLSKMSVKDKGRTNHKLLRDNRPMNRPMNQIFTQPMLVENRNIRRDELIHLNSTLIE